MRVPLCKPGARSDAPYNDTRRHPMNRVRTLSAALLLAVVIAQAAPPGAAPDPDAGASYCKPCHMQAWVAS